MNMYSWGSQLACILILLVSLVSNAESATAENATVDTAYNILVSRLSLKIGRENRLAMQSVWQTDAPDWRWRMQAVACEPTEPNKDAMQRTLRSGFPAYLETMNQQLNLPSMVKENINLSLARRFTSDLIYMAYQSSAKGYSQAYIQRLNILFRYYPKLKDPLCEKALEQAKSVADVYPNKVMRNTTSDDLNSNKVLIYAFQDMGVNMRYGAKAYWISMKDHYQVNDANLYTVIQKDRKSFDTLSKFVSGAPSRTEYHQALKALHKSSSEQKITHRHSAISTLNIVLNRRMYSLATLSVLQQTLDEYDDFRQPMIEHMKGYVQRAIDKVTSAEYSSDN